VAEDVVFKGRHFDRSVILLCVRWYLAYNLSLRKTTGSGRLFERSCKERSGWVPDRCCRSEGVSGARIYIYSRAETDHGSVSSHCHI